MSKRPDGVTAYPLCWPDGWPRTPEHKRNDGTRFKGGPTYEGYGDSKRYLGRKNVTFAKAAAQLFEEMGRLKATNLTISTNARTRQDGGIYADDAAKRYDDPGVAIYFTHKGKPMVMAQDAYDGLAANLRSLGLAIEAMRQLERHGGGTMMERAFAGFSALPAPDGYKPSRPWWEVLRYPADPAERELLSIAEVKARFNTLAKKLHPDVEGGSHAAMVELNHALSKAEEELGGGDVG